MERGLHGLRRLIFLNNIYLRNLRNPRSIYFTSSIRRPKPMDNYFFLKILLTTVVLSFSSAAASQNDIYHIDSIDRFYPVHPEEALRRIDSLRTRCEQNGYKDCSPQKLNTVEGIIYLRTNQIRLALFYLETGLKEAEKAGDLFYETMALQQLILGHSHCNQQKQMAHYTQQLLKRAGNHPDYKFYKAWAWLVEAAYLNQSKHFDKAQEAIDAAITAITGSSDFRILYGDALRIQAEVFFQKGAYQEALQTCQTLLDKIREDYPERSRKDATPIVSYELEKQKTYAFMSLIYTMLRDHSQADFYFREALILANRYPGLTVAEELCQICYYLNQSGKYEQAEEILKPQIRRANQTGDTLNSLYKGILKEYINALEGQKKKDEAHRYLKQYVTISDTLTEREREQSVNEFNIIYRTKEKETRLEKNRAELRQQSVVIILLFTIIGLMLFSGWRILRYSRTVKNKNKVLMQRVNEQMEYRNELREIKEKNAELIRQIKQQMPAGPETTEYEPLPHEAADETTENQLIFDKLNREMLTEKLYLNPNLSREDLIRIAHLNKNRFAQMIQENTGMKLNGYLNDLRIDHAIGLLKTYPEYTLQAIATDSGFTNMGTFHALFKKKTGMTPSEYKAASKF